MSDFNPRLGQEIHAMLVAKGIETPMSGANFANKRELIDNAFFNIMTWMGLDLKDPSLKDTPKRVAKMFCEEIFTGLDYKNFPECTAIPNDMNYDEMIVTTAAVKSTCEHHCVAILGQATIGYIPGGRLLGLSKFNRVVDFFARRPQVQERLTAQISAALQHILQTDDVGVVIDAEHLCVKFRGVQDAASHTITSQLGGRFRDGTVRSEFLALYKSR